MQYQEYSLIYQLLVLFYELYIVATLRGVKYCFVIVYIYDHFSRQNT